MDATKAHFSWYFSKTPFSSRLTTPLEQKMTVVMLLVFDQDHGKWRRQHARQFVRITPWDFESVSKSVNTTNPAQVKSVIFTVK